MLRIGTGAGFSADRLDPAVDLVDHGDLDYIIFECIGERTLAFGHRDRMQNPDAGFNPLLERRFREILPHCRQQQTKIVTNMGVANPSAAARRTRDLAQQLGLEDLTVAAILGDDVSHLIDPQTELPELSCTAGDLTLLAHSQIALTAPIVSTISLSNTKNLGSSGSQGVDRKEARM